MKESPMDIDSDSSGKDSAVNVDLASGIQPGMMLADNSTDVTSQPLASEDKPCDPKLVVGGHNSRLLLPVSSCVQH